MHQNFRKRHILNMSIKYKIVIFARKSSFLQCSPSLREMNVWGRQRNYNGLGDLRGGEYCKFYFRHFLCQRYEILHVGYLMTNKLGFKVKFWKILQNFAKLAAILDFMWKIRRFQIVTSLLFSNRFYHFFAICHLNDL